MKTRLLFAVLLPLYFYPLTGCKKAASDVVDAVKNLNVDARDQDATAKLRPVKDPIQEQIYAYRMETRQAYNTRRFDDLEKNATAIRATKELFPNGSWKIVQFYDSFGCRDDEPESMWQLHDQIHQDWIAAKPASISARVAYADFLIEYAWHARGSGYANTVTEDGWRLMKERLAAANKITEDAKLLPEKDPVWWSVRLRIALGESWTPYAYERLLAEAHAFEPKFWGYDTARAYSLLPRWHGEPGDWEAYAEEASVRPNGLGAETYARIVLSLYDYYDNVFTKTKASWPKTREGLQQMREKYPESIELVSYTAKFAAFAQDQTLAKEMFDKLGDTYLPGVWKKPENFTRYRKWAETGVW